MSRDDNKDGDRTESMGGFDQEPDRPRIERLGHFKIEATLGSGGMGTIYRAYDESMKRPVALKVLHSSLEISERAQSRFVREAWIAGQLDHPNIIKVFSRGEENRVSYLALELAEGGSLSDLIEQTRESIPSGSDVADTVDQDYIKDILAKFIELAGALEHIHSKGFIHRDIKPQNVLLSGADRKFKLTDFGIAHAKDMTRMTQAGDFIGTVRYMSPELLAAHRAGIDKRTDIYSLGVTLYEALTLTLPFKADSEEKLIGEILAGHCIEARKVNRRIPVDLETVLMKACNHDPDLRYQTAAEFADDLQRIIDGRPVLARRQSVVSKSIKYLKRNHRAVLGISAAAVIVVGTVFWAYYKIEQAYRAGADESTKLKLSVEPTFTKIGVPGLTEYCALSPDGKRIAFVADDSCLWIVSTHGPADPTVAGAPVRLTEPMVRWTGSSYPTWSADGNWIAFNGRGTYDNDTSGYRLSMFVIPSSGGEPRELPIKPVKYFSFPVYPRNCRMSLSPDGRNIAFSTDSSLFSGEIETGRIYSMPVAGGEISQLTDDLCDQPTFSPDGRMIAYVRADPPDANNEIRQSDIWVIPIDGGVPIQISKMQGIARSPVWSPDSRMIAFNRLTEHANPDGEYETEELFIVTLSETYQPIAPPALIELPLPSIDLMAGWSSGNQIGIILNTPTHGAIYTVSASGGIATQVTPSFVYSPSWSPNGERLFFIDNTVIRSIPAEGGQASSVPITGLWQLGYVNCDVSPDGEKLAFPGIPPGDSMIHIYTVSVDGGEPLQLTFDPWDDFYPCWSPDGKWIAFKRHYDRRSRLCVIPDSGGNVRELVVSDSYRGGGIGQMAWSPDGKFIAYSSYHSDSSMRISMIPFEGGQSEPIVQLDPGFISESVSWSPDGTKLCYCSYFRDETHKKKSRGDIWILPLDTKRPAKLRTGLDLEDVWQAEWSPDGERIAFSCRWGKERDFYLVDNFLPLAKPVKPEPLTEAAFSMVNVPSLLDYCALSPDGDRIAFVATNSCLWVAPTHGPADPTVAGEAVKLTDPIIEWARSSLPVWSADGNWIAFNTNDFDSASSYWTSMYVIPSSGGELIEVPMKHDRLHWLAFCDFRISLSPDGKEIAFFSHTSPIPGDPKEDCIYTMPVGGGEIQRLADSLCGHQAYCGHPTYSPDGKMIAFLRGDRNCGLANESAGCDIWVVPVGGGSPVQVTDSPGVEFGPVWAPDGKKMAFSHWTEMEKGGWDIRKLSVVSLSESYQPVGPPTVIDLPLPSDDFIGGWSTDGEIGLVLETEFLKAIYTIPASGGIATMIKPSISHSPSWSPDGERIYYVGAHDVYSVPAGGGQESIVPISGFYGSEGGCDLSPDGNRLAIAQEGEGDSILHIFTVSADGGEPKQVTFGPLEDWYPRWSRGGNWIAFWRSKARGLKSLQTHLCVVPAEGGDVKVLVPWTDSCGFHGGLVDWSPDGKFIVYPSYHDDSLIGISVQPFDGGAPELLLELESGRTPYSVRWSPDGSKLVYSVISYEYGSSKTNLWILPLDTREPRELEMIGYDWDLALRADWSPDGEKIVFEGRQPPRNTLCIIKDFLPEE